MTSFQITLPANKRAGARFVSRVRNALQKALLEEAKLSGLNQSEIAKTIGVHRSAISRELNGMQDITLRRVGELAHAMGRIAALDLPKIGHTLGGNHQTIVTSQVVSTSETSNYNFPPETSSIETNIQMMASA